jgi:hypothetical protein
LQGSANASARYNDGSEWTNLSFETKVAHRNGTLRLTLRDDGSSCYALQVSPADVKLFKIVAGLETQLGDTLLYAYPPDEYLTVEFKVAGDRLSAAIDCITIFENVDGVPAAGELKKGTVGFQVVATDGAEPVWFDDVKVIRLTGKGMPAETLLAEPFTTELPADWTFSGATPWAISAAPSPVMDLSPLLNVVLSLDYRYEMNVSASPSQNLVAAERSSKRLMAGSEPSAKEAASRMLGVEAS